MIEVCVYVKHGYFSYEVSTVEAACAHAHVIMSSGVYRREVDGGMEFHAVTKVKLRGEGLESEYKDKFRRT